MAYTVLARRYRPQTFDEVVGQDAISRTLKNAISSDRVAHAYLFTGTRGVGKTTMARLLAKALNCQKDEKPTIEPCGECESCQRTQRGDDLDVIEIDGASNTGVDNIRDLRSSAIFAPARSRYKIYIIDEVHMLSTGAFNALLKTLEEPPEHVKFIFATTDAQKVPQTIHSRCQRFDFRSVPAAVVADYLEKLCQREGIEAERAALEIVAREGRGSVRDSLTILDQTITLCEGNIRTEAVLEALGLTGGERYFALVEKFVAGDAAGALVDLDRAIADGAELGEYLEHLLDHLRGLLLICSAGPKAPGLEVTREERARLAEQSRKLNLDQVTMAMEIASETRQRIRALPHGRPLVELMMVQLCRLPQLAELDDVLSRLKDGGEASGSGQGGVEKKKHHEVKRPAVRSSDLSATGVMAGPKEGGETIAPAARAARPADESDDAEDEAAPAGESVSERPLTMAEQEALRNDPAVKRVLEMFGGRIVDMKKV
jgi:DNA polymerase III subunit gamma/tau